MGGGQTSAAERSVSRFCRQYLQLERDLDYPAGEFLREDQVQALLCSCLFGDGSTPHPPPPRYQLRVLKELLSRIEGSIEDWEQHGVSDDLMSRLSELLASPIPSELDNARQRAYVTYSLSSHDSESGSTCPTVTLLESRNLISAAGTTGLRTWEAALHLGQYLCTQPSLIRNKRVLELGAGTGYLAILCAKFLEPCQVIASDGSNEVVANLPENFCLNDLQDSDIISSMDLKWGHALIGKDEEHWNRGRPVDVVLGADITYDQSIIPALVATLGDLIGLFPAVKILVAATERNRITFEAFLVACQRRGFRVEEIEFILPSREEQRGPFYSDQVPIRICEIS